MVCQVVGALNVWGWVFRSRANAPGPLFYRASKNTPVWQDAPYMATHIQSLDPRVTGDVIWHDTGSEHCAELGLGWCASQSTR
jgi:hypothetical protein